MAQKSGFRKRRTVFDSMMVFSDSAMMRRTSGIALYSSPEGVRTQNAREAPEARKRPESVVAQIQPRDLEPETPVVAGLVAEVPLPGGQQPDEFLSHQRPPGPSTRAAWSSTMSA